MAIKIQSIKTAVGDNGIKILVHGPAGSGKTVMCGTAGRRTLLISAEGGLLSLQGAIDTGLLPEAVQDLVDVIEVTDLEGLMEAYEYAKKHIEYEWVMLDSISEIGEVVLETEKQFSKDPRQAYGALITEMQALLRKFRDIPNKNVLFTCKQQRVVDSDTEKTMYLPSMPGSKLHQAIPYMFDEVFALRVEKDDEGEDFRILQTNRDGRYEAKDRSGKLEMWEEPSLFALMKKIGSTAAENQQEVDEEDDDYDSESEADEGQVDSDSQQDDHEGTSDAEGSDADDPSDEPSDEDDEEDEELEPVIAKKAMYWLHEPSGKLATTEKGDDIAEFLNNDDVAEISKLKHTKLSKAKE